MYAFEEDTEIEDDEIQDLPEKTETSGENCIEKKNVLKVWKIPGVSSTLVHGSEAYSSENDTENEDVEAEKSNENFQDNTMKRKIKQKREHTSNKCKKHEDISYKNLFKDRNHE